MHAQAALSFARSGRGRVTLADLRPRAVVAKKKAKQVSPGCIALAAQLKSGHIHGFVTEYQFAPGRRWRFDFANLALRIAIEVDGSSAGGAGGHGYTSARERDNEKLAEAVARGWRVLRGTTAQAEDGRLLAWVKRCL